MELTVIGTWILISACALAALVILVLVLGSEESRQGRKNRRLGVYQEDSKPGAERESPIKIPTPESGAFVPAVLSGLVLGILTWLGARWLFDDIPDVWVWAIATAV